MRGLALSEPNAADGADLPPTRRRVDGKAPLPVGVEPPALGALAAVGRAPSFGGWPPGGQMLSQAPQQGQTRTWGWWRGRPIGDRIKESSIVLRRVKM